MNRLRLVYAFMSNGFLSGHPRNKIYGSKWKCKRIYSCLVTKETHYTSYFVWEDRGKSKRIQIIFRRISLAELFGQRYCNNCFVIYCVQSRFFPYFVPRISKFFFFSFTFYTSHVFTLKLIFFLFWSLDRLPAQLVRLLYFSSKQYLSIPCLSVYLCIN